MRISDWSSDVCSSDLEDARLAGLGLACEPDILAAAVAERAFELPRLARRNGVPRGEGETRRERRVDARHLDRRDEAVADARDGGDHALAVGRGAQRLAQFRSEEHTSELQSLMRISYAVFCLKKKKK